MRFVEEFRDPQLASGLIREIHRLASSLGEVRLMEVCGTHTVSIFKHGIRDLLPRNIRLLSGPGCPVCVTPTGYLDQAQALAREPGITMLTFGDMMRVPGSASSLEIESARGGDIRVVYSPLDALAVAKANGEREAVFLAVGFETTAPLVAATVLRAVAEGVRNFSVLAAHKRVLPAMEALLAGEDMRLDGFICPPHVSAVIGSQPYETVSETWGIPCVIAGFEPLDILQGIQMLLAQILKGEHRVEVQYRRVVRREGNLTALRVMEQVLEIRDSVWRGLGVIPSSGLYLREELSQWDASHRFQLSPSPGADPPGCQCGRVLSGVIEPFQCGLFGSVCNPWKPVGPCMVSTEGTCAAHFKYGSYGAVSSHLPHGGR